MELLEFFMGIVLGIITGLVPGLHPNTIAAVLSQLSLTGESTASIIIGMFPANIIAAFIPAIFFGIPEQETVLCALAGQRLALEGRGLTALKVVLVASVIAAAVSFVLFMPSMVFFSSVYYAIRNYIPYILLVLSAVVLLKSRNPFLALLVFLASGLLGQFSLNSGMYDPFMPVFSGMFAIGMLLNITETKIPEQKKEEKIGIEVIKYSLLGVVLGACADLLPGISSPSQVALFATIAIPLGSLSYLATISSIGVSEGMFSLATFASINKSRVGTTAWLSEFTGIKENAMLLAFLFLVGIIISAAIIYLLRKKVASAVVLNSKPIAYALIAYLAFICFLLDSWLGLAVLALAAALGWLTVRLGVEKVNLMGAVLLPTLMLLFGIVVA